MKFVFLVLLGLQISISIWFHRRQNAGALVGGPISWPKAFWLYHATFSWYLVPLVYLVHPNVATSLKWLIGIHALIWWIRAPIELVMIYRTFNWSPRFGITHDALHSAGLVAGLVFVSHRWEATLVNWMAVSYIGVTIIMLGFETAFAALFLQVRGDSDHKTYYADDSEKWRFINRLTTVALMVGLIHAVVQAAIALCYWL